jgi:hypothetical protein
MAYKHYLRARNTLISSWGGLNEDKPDILREIASIRQKPFKQRTIRHSFLEEAGIYPFKPLKILDDFLKSKF